MKKTKLPLDGLKVSSFRTSESLKTRGGIDDSVYICDSVARCQTIHYTACNGERFCQKYML